MKSWDGDHPFYPPTIGRPSPDKAQWRVQWVRTELLRFHLFSSFGKVGLFRGHLKRTKSKVFTMKVDTQMIILRYTFRRGQYYKEQL